MESKLTRDELIAWDTQSEDHKKSYTAMKKERAKELADNWGGLAQRAEVIKKDENNLQWDKGILWNDCDYKGERKRLCEEFDWKYNTLAQYGRVAKEFLYARTKYPYTHCRSVLCLNKKDPDKAKKWFIR